MCTKYLKFFILFFLFQVGQSAQAAFAVQTQAQKAARRVAMLAGHIKPTVMMSAATAAVRPHSTASSAQNNSSEQELNKAAYNGDLEKVQQLVRAGVNINALEPVTSWTPLINAACGGHLAIVEFLVENGANVNAKEVTHRTALDGAETEAIKTYLKQHGAKKGSELGSASSSSASSAAKADWPTTGSSSSSSSSSSAQSNSSEQELNSAAANGDLAKVQQLVRAGVNINAREPVINWTPLINAACGGYLAIVEFLVENGANVNAKGARGDTALDFAKTEAIETYLKQHGAQGRNSGHASSSSSSASSAAKADWPTTGSSSSSSSSSSAQSNSSEQELNNAAYHGDFAKVQQLVRAGANVNARESHGGWTPLIQAAGGRLAIVEFLVEHGADINAKSFSGSTALDMAKINGNTAVIAYLQSHGAKIGGKLTSSSSSASSAAKADWPTTGSSSSSSSSSSAQSNSSEQELNKAAFHGDLAKVQLLVKAGVDVNAREEGNGWTPLINAAHSGLLAIVEFLVENGADIHAKSYKGNTALDNAATENVKTYLRQRGAQGRNSGHESSSSSSLNTARQPFKAPANVPDTTEDGFSVINPDDIKESFASLIIDDATKKYLQFIVKFLKNPDAFSKLGIKCPKGVLLEGPPGTGKTSLGRVIAKESGCAFIPTCGSEFDGNLVGDGTKKVRALFAMGKQYAPAILFIDEIDTIGKKRTATESRFHSQTIQQLLSEMDGFNKLGRVLVVATTNNKGHLDAALLRPGRFDRHVHVPLPTQENRKKILLLHAKKTTLAQAVDDKVFDQLAAKTIGCSGADLEGLINEAAMNAAMHDKQEVTLEDLHVGLDVIMQQKKSGNQGQTEKLISALEALRNENSVAREPLPKSKL